MNDSEVVINYEFLKEIIEPDRQFFSLLIESVLAKAA